MQHDPILEAVDVSIRYPGHDDTGRRTMWAAVDGVSLSIAAGERVGIVGESGSGKTTLGKAMLGIERTAAGVVRFRGQDIARLKGDDLESFRRGAQMIFQDPMGSLNPRLSVGSAIGEVLSVHRLASREDRPARVRELLQQVGLDPDYAGRYPHEFSGGQRQRIGIARALALQPSLLVADEPVSALDVSVQAQILNLLRDLSEARGMAVVLVAHDLAVVNYVCRRVLILYRGRVVEEGPTEAVFGHPCHPYTKLLKSAVPDPDIEVAEEAVVPEPPMSAMAREGVGCAFAARCPQATARCLESAPVLSARDPGRRVACHFA